MDRRTFPTRIAFGVCAFPPLARAQAAGRTYRVGLLSSAAMRSDAEFRQSNWAQALRDLGWVEGQNVLFARRASDNKADLLPGLARELVAAKVDVIATFGSSDTIAAMRATSAIPIVMVFSGRDPVEEGFVASFARPGGNVTGVSRMLAETDAKRLELIKEMLPSAGRIGVLFNARDEADRQAKFERDMQAAARNLRVELRFYPYRSQEDVDAAFPAMSSDRVQAFQLEPQFLTFRNRGRIAELALKHRLPGAFTLREYAEAGGLFSYGPDWLVLERQHARYVDRILRGANPAELPLEQPTKFDLVINLKTAKALGVAVPQPLLLRADQLIA
jgi:putative ABC transport system substrate-binding protein